LPKAALQRNHGAPASIDKPIRFENSVDFTPVKPSKIKQDQYKLI